MKHFRNRGFGRRIGAGVMTSCAALVASIQAQTVTKLDTASISQTAADWSAAPATTDIGLFDGTISAANAGNLSLTSDVTLGGLQFAGGIPGAVVINAGNTLTLGASGIDMGGSPVAVTLNSSVALGANQTWNTGGQDLTVNGAISGAYGITKTGGGRIIMGGSASNTFTGDLVLNGGPAGGDVYALMLSKTGGATAVAGNLTANGHGWNIYLGGNEQIADTSLVTLNNGSKLQLNGFTETVGGLGGAGGIPVIQSTEAGNNVVSTLIVNSAFDSSFSGRIRNSASGTGNVLHLTKTGAATLTLIGDDGNPYSGDTTINQGTLFVSNNAIGDASRVVFSSDPSATLRLGFTERVRSLHGGSGAGGTIDLQGQRLFFTGDATPATANFGGTIIGTGGLLKDGTGIQMLSGTNSSFSGSTIIQGGILNVASIANYGVNSSIGNRAADGLVTGDDRIGILFRGGTLQYTGSTAQSTNRAIRLSTTGGGGTIDASGSDPSATLSFTALSSPDLWENPGARTLTLTGTNTGDNFFDIKLDNQGANLTSLVKSGTGTWRIRGIGGDDNTYGGDTTILGGTLVADGAAAIGDPSRVVFADTAGATLRINNPERISALHGGGTTGGTVDLQGNRLSFNGRTTPADANFAGVITGAGGITKDGAGTQILSGTNSDYAGSTIIAGGVLNIASISDYGVNSSIGNRSSAEGPAGDNRIGILFRGGTLQYTGATAQSTNRAIRVSTNGGAYLDASGANHGATLTFTNAASPDFWENGGSRQVTFTGSNQGNNSFNMAITEIGGTTTVNKTGTGTWRLTGASSYTGNTNVNAGTLLVNGTLANTPTNVQALATLGGTGSIGGPVTVLGAVSPGGSSASNSDTLFGIGTLTVNNSATFQNGSTLRAQASGASGNAVVGAALPTSTPGGLVDHLIVSGALNFNGEVEFSLTDGYTPLNGDYFDIVDAGSYSGLASFDFSQAALTGGLTWNTSLFASHGILQVVPEPSRAGLALLTLAAIAWRRRRS